MYKLYPLFSYPVLTSNIGYTLSLEEQNKVKELRSSPTVTGSITQSLNFNVLDLKEFRNLKLYIDNFINIYKNNILKANEEIEIYITQSWLNWGTEEEFVHKHEHPNSFLSGVFYIDAKNVPTKFEIKNRIFPIELGPFKEWTFYNSGSHKIDVENNNLIIFPSTLPHYTEQIKSKEERITLAFNTFVRGKIGSDKDLYGLKLK